MVPLVSCAYECAPPAEIASTPERLVTITGVDELMVVPLPSWPDVLAPQHLTVPFASSAHEWLPPAVIATALREAAHDDGRRRVGGGAVAQLTGTVAPQHLTVPFTTSAQECAPPAVTSTAAERPLTTTGVDEFVVVPLPSCPEVLPPQHLTVPSDQCARMQLTDGHGRGSGSDARPDHCRGRAVFVVVPLPSWPYQLSPQHLTVASCPTPHVSKPARADRADSGSPLTAIGVVRGDAGQ